MAVTAAGRLRASVQERLDRRGDYPRWVLLTALVGMFATTYPVTILAVSLETIADDFETSVKVIAWVISGPLLASSVALPILGKLGDLHGHRRVFLAGFTVSTVVTALTVFAWDPISLIVLRSIAVMVGAATVPSSMALINGVHAPAERVQAMGWWAFVAAGSPAIGLVIGGPLIDAVGWRPVFAIQAVLASVAVSVAFLVLRETRQRTDVGFDIPGGLALATAAGGLMFALNQAPDRGADTMVLVAGTVGAVALALFIWIESRVAFPLLPLDFFRRRNFTAALIAALFSGAAYMGGFVLAPLLLQSVFAYSVSATSLVVLIRPAVFSAASPIGSSAATRFGERNLAVFGSSAIVAALALLGLGAEQGVVAFVIAALALQGIGNGTAQPSLNAVIANSVDETDLGIAAAAQRMTFQLGSALGITAMTAVYGDTERASDFALAYGVGAGIGLLAVGGAFFVTSADRSETGATSVPTPATVGAAGR